MAAILIDEPEPKSQVHNKITVLISANQTLGQHSRKLSKNPTSGLREDVVTRLK